MERKELSYDGHGINGPDEYGSRIATFAASSDRNKYGPLFAAAPDLLDVCEAVMKMFRTRELQESGNTVMIGWTEQLEDLCGLAKTAIAQADGVTPITGDEERGFGFDHEIGDYKV